MRITLFLLASALALVAAVPAARQELVFATDGDEGDVCPDLKVRCVKDGDWPGGIVGDIGKKPFCRSGIRCNQCHPKVNTAECNAKFLKDCAGGCEAYGPVPI